MNVGIFGGTFNPVHQGHLMAAELARVHCGLDRVLFVPNRRPPHRRGGEAGVSDDDRYAMLVLATASHPGFYVSRVELDRDDVSYSVDTVTLLRLRHPDDQLCFITGTDAILRHVWKDFDRLLGMVHSFVVLARPGASRSELIAHLDRLPLENRARINILDTPQVDISSSGIRKILAQQGSVRYQVPDLVLQHIAKHGLYGPASTGAPAGPSS